MQERIVTVPTPDGQTGAMGYHHEIHQGSVHGYALPDRDHPP